METNRSMSGISWAVASSLARYLFASNKIEILLELFSPYFKKSIVFEIRLNL